MASLFVHNFSYEFNTCVVRVTCRSFYAAGGDESRMRHFRGRAFS
jgi:hypothetical protein